MSQTTTNDITELHSHLFDALRGLKDKTDPLDIERAKAIAAVSQTIINSAKIEVEFIKATGSKGSGFIPEAPNTPALPDGASIISQKPGLTITRHTCK
jgi:hypothetical protein